MSRDDFAFPCADCLCNHCANNVETGDSCTGEAKIFCFFCDECKWFDGNPSNKDMRRWKCEQFVITQQQAERLRKKIRRVK